MEQEARQRLSACARMWRVSIERTVETETSLLAFGGRGRDSVVLKVLKQSGDEWNSGEVLAAFHGNGVVRVHDYVEGAVLLERLDPAKPLVSVVFDGRDDEATDILAAVMNRMRGAEPPERCTTVQDWGTAFERYLETRDRQIPERLVRDARRWFSDLCASQRRLHLLHGDLHHYNVVFDSVRGWVAIDPKGVIGEIEYEIGAALRNPVEMPEIVSSPQSIQRRLERFSKTLGVDVDRTLSWAFAQAVLSAIWYIEDGVRGRSSSLALRLAQTIDMMLSERA